MPAHWTLDPAHPAAGEPTHVQIALSDPATGPVVGARLQLEAQMSHPGMSAIVVPLMPAAPGVYQAVVQLSMQGNWVLMATGETPDGRRVRSSLPIAGVTVRR